MSEPRDRDRANEAQIEYWNSGAGASWVARQEILDASFAAITERLLARAAARPGERILDIGCGAGATTIELALRVGTHGHVLGVDISRALLDKALERTERAAIGNVRYILADAQTHEFPPSSCDLMVSRFGVMFFSDPVAAFSNIAAALSPGGRVTFVSWAGLQANPWFKIQRDAAIARLGDPEPLPANAPGPLAFQDTAYVADILSKAGLFDISAEVEELRLVVPGSLQDVADFASNIGPASRIVKEKGGSPEDVAAIARDIAEGLSHYVTEDGVSVPAALNFYAAVRR